MNPIAKDARVKYGELGLLFFVMKQGQGYNKVYMIPYLVDCCKAYATVGEMTNVFRDIFGEFVEPSIF